MNDKPREKLTLRVKREAEAGSRAKPRNVIEVQRAPDAYVAPEPTEQEIDAMTDGQRINYLVGTNVNEWEWDRKSEGEGELDWWPEDDNYDPDDEGPIDDQLTAAFIKQWQRDVPHDPGAPEGVEIDGADAALKELLLAVAIEVSRWKKPPKAEATAAGIGLAIAGVRRERGVKHPRDIAKEVGVRAQTLHQIKNVALQEIQRLRLESAFREASSEEPGTYTQSERQEDEDAD